MVFNIIIEGITMNKNSYIYQAVRSCYYGVKNAPKTFKKYLDTRSIKRFHNRYIGQTCFIIGNGPSMTFKDLDRIQELKIASFACNKIYLGFNETLWRPTFYFVSDNKIIKDIDIGKIDVPVNRMFFPIDYKKIVKYGNFYSRLDHDWLHSDEFSTDAYIGVYSRETVVIEMIQFAYYMGFSKVYIIGVDFFYNMQSVNKENHTFVSEGNNYFIKGYEKKGEVINLGNMESNILGFRAAKKSFEDENREIYNATRGGKLEVFIRKDLDEVFSEIEAE